MSTLATQALDEARKSNRRLSAALSALTASENSLSLRTLQSFRSIFQGKNTQWKSITEKSRTPISECTNRLLKINLTSKEATRGRNFQYEKAQQRSKSLWFSKRNYLKNTNSLTRKQTNTKLLKPSEKLCENPMKKAHQARTIKSKRRLRRFYLTISLIRLCASSAIARNLSAWNSTATVSQLDWAAQLSATVSVVRTVQTATRGKKRWCKL